MRTGIVALAALAVLAGLATGTSRVHAAGAGDCKPNCVVLIEVDGLEPEDVTQATTPFLWALAHPQQRSGDQLSQANAALLNGRGGFMWQAARSPMSASTATSALSLLTGANPAQHGIVADEFMERNAGGDPKSAPLKPVQLAAAGDAAAGSASALVYDGTSSPIKPAPSALFQLMSGDDSGATRSSAAFIGDPALATLLGTELEQGQVDPVWSPDPTSDPGDPSLCPLPRTRPVNDAASASAPPVRLCPARDADTLFNAHQGLDAAAATHTPDFTYIHLAELGHVKALDGDPQAARPDSPATSSKDTPVKRALADLDGATAAFVAGYQNPGGNLVNAYGRTIFVVVGNHGYEPTPPLNRVGDPDNKNDPSSDFSDWVHAHTPNNAGTLVPQGTMGTVYAPGATDAQLLALAADIKKQGDAACALECIDQVLFAHPVKGADDKDLLRVAHPSWYYDPANAKSRTGAGGDLVVTLNGGWAFGRSIGEAPATGAGGVPLISDDQASLPNKELTNPYAASDGGPRNRAVALLMDGPGVAPSGGYAIDDMGGADAMAVKAHDDSCDSRHPAFSGVDFATANDSKTIGDDADAAGHECQAETVDIPLTIAALFKLPVPPTQVATQARFLNEALKDDVGFQQEEEIVEDTPPPEPPPPPEPEPIIIINDDIQVIPARPPKDPFPYYGLVRRLRARVTDPRGRAASAAKRGADLSTIEVSGDFGKPQTRVSLTFYKQGRKPASGGKRRLVAIARFKPFTVKRGPVTLRLRVPAQFAPTYLGLVVQEIDEAKQPVGPQSGGIVPIGQSRLLHTRAKIKPHRTARRRR